MESSVILSASRLSACVRRAATLLPVNVALVISGELTLVLPDQSPVNPLVSCFREQC